MLSKFTPVQDSSKFATLKKPAKVAIVRQQPSLDREMRGPIADPIYKYSSLTLPSGIVQPQIGPGGPLRYPFYRVQSPQTPRQNSVPNSPCCPNGPLPRVSGRMPQQPLQQRTSALPYATTANTLSCVATPITQRQARYLRKEVKQPTRQSAVPDEAAKTPSSSSSSRDSGIMSQDSSSSIQSFCIEDYNQSNPGGFRTPQCVPRRAKQVTRKTVVEAPAVKYRSGGGTLNRPKVTKSAIATTRLSTGPSTSCTSSPATPRASWNSSPAVVEGEQLKAANKVSRATSVCATGLEHQRRGPSKQVTAGQLASPNGKIPRPTNLAGDKGSRMDKDIGWFAGKIQSFKPEENASSERPSRNSSLPSGSDRCPATGSSHIPTPRAKTLSPPPQFASSSFSTPSTKTPKSPFSLSHPINSLTPDSSSTSTCTLAANPKGSSPSLAGTTTATGCANLDDTPTPSNRSSPEPRPPLASTPSVPLVVVDGKVQEFDKPAMTAPPSPRSPRLSPRLGGAGEDQSFGCSGCGPLSHFKLPYSTPVMQRMQHQQQAGISSSFGKRPLGAEGGGGLAKTPTCASNSNQPISEAFGSYMSLSSSGSVMSAANDSAAFEVAKLRRELELAHQKVAALTCQLSANASVVQAFEQSLQSLNQRLHQLSASSAIKEREVQELRKIIDRFRCQAALNDWPSILENARDGKKLSQSQEFVKPHHIIETDVMQQAGSLSSLVQSPHSVTGYPEINRYIQEVTPRGYMSPSYMPIRDSFERNSKKGGWLRTSLNRAFRRSKSRDPPDRARVTSTSSAHDPTVPGSSSGSSVRHSPNSSSGESPVNQSAASSITGAGNGLLEQPSSTAKDQFDSLSRQHQLHIMQETVLELQHQVSSLRAENALLQQTVDRCSQASGSDKGSVTGSASLSTTGQAGRLGRLLRELYSVNPEVGRRPIPVFLELSYRHNHSRPIDEHMSSRLASGPTSPTHSYLAQPTNQSQPLASPNPSARLYASTDGARHCDVGSNDLTHLHLLGRVCVEASSPILASDIRSKVKNLLRIYLNYLDSDEHIGLSPEAISSITIKAVPQSVAVNQSLKEFQLSPNNNEPAPLRIDPDHEISHITIRLHENAYAVERPVAPSLLNPLSVSSIAWISLLPCSLLSKMIESILANKSVIIYGPRGSGKLEFGRILIDAMSKMFPGFWVNPPNACHYYLRATPNATNELRQVLMNGLLAVEGLIILRLPPSLLPDLVKTMSELGFNTNPRKILLLAITDTLIFPEEPTKLKNCPGIFPFIADVQSAAGYMRRCLRQRFSQFAFQCLEASNTVELDGLTEIIEWLPGFWLRAVSAAAAWQHTNVDDASTTATAFPFSPFRLLACPLTLQASSVWFREVCEAEGVFRRVGDAERDLVRWLAATWPWPNDQLPLAFTPYGLGAGDSMTASTMIMYDSSASLPALLSTGDETRLDCAGRSIRRTSPRPIIRR